MSKIIKYNDYVQINPDKRIYSLEKAEKIKIIDNMLESSSSGGRGLVITYDLSHSGRRINNRIYSTKGQQRGIDSLTEPYNKPILRNHDQSSEPIGRFIGGEFQDLHQETANFLQSPKAIQDIHTAFAGDDPAKIYNTMKSLNLLNNKQWPGLGRMRVQANITDEDAIKKFMDGRYLTFSAGSTTDRHVCSICESDWTKDSICEHRHGKVYDDETCVFITGDFLVLEGSVVNTPADDLSQMVHMELMDSLEGENTMIDKSIYLDEMILSDSKYSLEDPAKLYLTNISKSSTPKISSKEAMEKVKQTLIADFDSDIIIYNKNNISLTANCTKELSMENEDNKPIEEPNVDVSEDLQESADSKTREEEDTEAPPPVAPEKEEIKKISDNSDWEFLDLALQGILFNTDHSLSEEQRAELPESSFCGPDRTFPIVSREHIDAAKKLIQKYNGSESLKEKLIQDLDLKLKSLDAYDSLQNHIDLQDKFSKLEKQYIDLENKFKTVIESILVKKAEKATENIEKEIVDNVIALENKVESPSQHVQDENVTQKQAKKLPAFEQKIVDEYKLIEESAGEYAAMLYLQNKTQYLPRGFNPNKF
jgi:hypothetical protein